MLCTCRSLGQESATPTAGVTSSHLIALLLMIHEFDKTKVISEPAKDKGLPQDEFLTWCFMGS